MMFKGKEKLIKKYKIRNNKYSSFEGLVIIISDFCRKNNI